MIALLFVLVLVLLALFSALFLLGFRLGGGHWKSELARVRMEGAQAERALHDITRQAFVAMAEEAQRRMPGNDIVDDNR